MTAKQVSSFQNNSREIKAFCELHMEAFDRLLEIGVSKLHPHAFPLLCNEM